MRDILVPDIGDFKDVEVIEILVKPGDAIAPEQSLVTLESDKATMEIPSSEAGIVKELAIKVGDRVSRGSLILRVDEKEAPAAPVPAAAQAEAPAPAAVMTPAAETKPVSPAVDVGEPVVSPTPAVQPVPRESHDEAQVKPHASPSVRQFARELGVPLGSVTGSGPKGRILHTDVQSFVKAVLARKPGDGTAKASSKGGGSLPFNLPAWPQVDFARFGPIEARPLPRVQKISGPVLHRNWISIPHVTQFDEADITDLEAFRKANSGDSEKRGFKLTMLAFLMKACVTALKQFPQFNASLDASGEGIIVKRYFHIGVAVDTSEGLVVPVIRDADRKGVFDLAKELADVSKLAREKKLRPGDMQGGTFSISSLGGIGGTAFTPIINAPEVAILGVSRSVMRPVWNGKEFAPRLMLPLSLSYDHRVIDGANAARFTAFLTTVLSDIRRTLL